MELLIVSTFGTIVLFTVFSKNKFDMKNLFLYLMAIIFALVAIKKELDTLINIFFYLMTISVLFIGYYKIKED